jgi:spore maturation protein B
VVLLLAFSGCFLWFGWQFFLAGEQPRHPLIGAVEAISYLAIPFLVAFFPLYASLCRVKVYEEFVEGAKEGFQVAVRIIPYLVAIIAAVAMFRAAGGIDLITKAIGPALALIQFPPELLPLALIRPLSGSGANGIFAELVQTYGADSLLARMGASIMGSTETTFYVIAVYFGSIAVRRTRHAVPAGLVADATGMIASVIICNLVFGK